MESTTSTVFRLLYEHVPEVFNYRNDASTSYKFNLEVNSSEGNVVLTGLDLFLETCADVEVKVTAGGFTPTFISTEVFYGQV